MKDTGPGFGAMLTKNADTVKTSTGPRGPEDQGAVLVAHSMHGTRGLHGLSQAATD